MSEHGLRFSMAPVAQEEPPSGMAAVAMIEAAMAEAAVPYATAERRKSLPPMPIDDPAADGVEEEEDEDVQEEEEEEAPVMAEVVGTPFVVEEEDAKDAMMTMEADQHLLIKRYQRGLAACHLAATTALHRRSSLLKGLIHFEDKRFAWVWGVWAGMAKRQQAIANRARLLKTTALVHRHANASRVIQSALNVWKYSIIRARYNTASQAVLEASINFHQQQQGHKAFKRWRDAAQSTRWQRPGATAAAPATAACTETAAAAISTAVDFLDGNAAVARTPAPAIRPVGPMTSKLYYAPSPTITIKPKPATTITRAAVQEAVAAVASGQSPAQRAIEELLSGGASSKPPAPSAPPKLVLTRSEEEDEEDRQAREAAERIKKDAEERMAKRAAERAARQAAGIISPSAASVTTPSSTEQSQRRPHPNLPQPNNRSPRRPRGCTPSWHASYFALCCDDHPQARAACRHFDAARSVQ